jgi:UDP-arabinose 4-epimerase
MTPVLVTGGAGYIGSHTCKALARAGYAPVAYDNLARGKAWTVKWGPLEIGDIVDTSRLSEVIETYRPSAVIHFAGFGYVGESVEDPARYYRSNVAGTLGLLDAMRRGGIEKIVFSSTCATYGIPRILPISEDEPQRPINPYGASKLMVERILADYRAAYGLKSISLRYFNAAGADPDGELGEDHEPEMHLIPLILDAAAGKRRDFTIFGDDFDTSDGTCIRDYVHVSDLADAHVRALRKLSERESHAAYNLGTGVGVSIGEIIAVVRRITGRDFRVVRGPRRIGDPAVLYADSSRARQHLDWAPCHPEITDMIESAWQWCISGQKRHTLAAQ